MGLFFEKAVEKMFEKMPALVSIIVLIGTVFIVLLLIAVFYRVFFKGDSLTFWGLELKTDKKFRDLQEDYKKLIKEFHELNQDSKQKSKILTILNDIAIEIGNVMALTDLKAFTEQRRLIYNLVLPAITSILTKDKDNYHRVAIFVPDGGSGELRIVRGLGFSTDDIKNFKLKIANSVAGWVYKNNKCFISGDAQNESLFCKHERSMSVNSLICVPISNGDKVHGVLNLDGEEPNSFSKDDVDYLRYFATLISALFELEPYVEERQAQKLMRGEENVKEQQRPKSS